MVKSSSTSCFSFFGSIELFDVVLTNIKKIYLWDSISDKTEKIFSLICYLNIFFQSSIPQLNEWNKDSFEKIDYPLTKFLYKFCGFLRGLVIFSFKWFGLLCNSSLYHFSMKLSLVASQMLVVDSRRS